MHFEINVAKNGEHLFATHERSLTSKEKAAEVYQLICERFPESKGYSVEITLHVLQNWIVTEDFKAETAARGAQS